MPKWICKECLPWRHVDRIRCHGNHPSFPPSQRQGGLLVDALDSITKC